MREKPLPDWDRLLAAAARLQEILPGTVLVGGTAAAAHEGHRLSVDADHVLADLRGRFDEILAQLESVAGWKTARVRRPVLVLGSLDGIETGIRQLIRAAPLETETIALPVGGTVTLPTRAEMLRIKAILILKRNATRDYLDFAALARSLGEEGASLALEPLDALYPQENGASPFQQLLLQLAEPLPFDLEGTDLTEYKRLAPEWQDWNAVRAACATLAAGLFRRAGRTRPAGAGDE